MAAIANAGHLISEADGLLITAGAGMGVDSGLPDFRGEEGFWTAYPALRNAGMNFTSIASLKSFSKSPRQAWGFYGHRLSLYRSTEPHLGFHILKSIAAQLPYGAFVVTSNVDGQFQKAGFAESDIFEVHGSIHRLQCTAPCTETVWPASSITPITDDERCEWVNDRVPICPKCRRVARPNILMFDDWAWIKTYATIGRTRFEQWLSRTKKIVVLEIGAGIALPAIRQIGRATQAPLIRMNPQKQPNDDADIFLECGALFGLQAIKAELEFIAWLPSPQMPAK